MHLSTQSNGRFAVLAAIAMVVVAACSGGSEAGGDVVSDPDPEDQTTSSAADDSSSTTATSTAAVVDDGPVVDFAPSADPLAPGRYRTDTDVSYEFTIPDGDGTWQGIVQDDWFVTILFSNASLSSGPDLEPGLNLAVAEEDATMNSVAEAMVASRPEIPYVRSDGLFGGRQTIILEGTHNHPGNGNPVKIETGEESVLWVLFEGERTYRSHIFEEGGRVFIVSIDAFVDDFELVQAEAGPVFESLEIGGDG